MGQVSTPNHLACTWKVKMKRGDSIKEEGNGIRKSKKSRKKHYSNLEPNL